MHWPGVAARERALGRATAGSGGREAAAGASWRLGSYWDMGYSRVDDGERGTGRAATAGRGERRGWAAGEPGDGDRERGVAAAS